MAYLNIVSGNPDFSYILSKNPETQKTNGKPFTKNTGDFNSYSWFASPILFSLLLTQNIKKKSDDFSYLEKSYYGNPEYIIKLIEEHLRTASSVPHEKDTMPVLVDFQMYMQHSRDVERFASVLNTKGFTISYEQQAPNVYKFCIQGPTLLETLNIVQLLAYITFVYSDNCYITDKQLARYFTMYLKYDASYKLVQTFLSRCISRQVFEFITKDADLDTKTGIIFKYGNNFEKRFNAITSLIENKQRTNEIVEIGCGEGNYFKMLSNKYDMVYSYEMDEEIQAKAKNTIARKQLENISLNGEFTVDDVPIVTDKDVLITEVLEHIEYKKSVHLLKALLKANPNSIIGTMPNKDFNYLYDLGPDEMRHDDHCYELTADELIKLLNNITSRTNYTYELTTIGDQIKDKQYGSSTLMFHIFKKA